METKFIPGVFAKESKNPAFINIGIKLEDFKNYINNLKPDSRGFVNFSMGKQKNDPTKYSMWLDTWKPNSSKSKNPSPPQQGDMSSDALPF